MKHLPSHRSSPLNATRYHIVSQRKAKKKKKLSVVVVDINDHDVEVCAGLFFCIDDICSHI